MALFKIFQGDADDLDSISLHEGYAYFVPSDGTFYIDASVNGSVTRVQLNGLSAEKLSDGTTTIEIDDIVLASDIIDAAHGGTGRATLTANAVIAGNGTGTVKLITSASGALYSTSSGGTPQFGTLPVAQGGTGATTAANARSNLAVYSTTEVDNKVTAVTATSYSITLSTNSWADSTGTVGGSTAPFTYTYGLTSITCGAGGNVCPLITKAADADEDEYAKITKAEATPGTGLVFTAEGEKPATINLIVIDFGSPV